MNNKKSTVIFAVFSVIVFVLAGITSIVSVKEGKEYKASNAAYMLYQNNNGALNGGISAKAESAKKQADEHKTKLIKFVAISLLLYFALLIMLILLYLSTVKDKENRQQNKIE